MISGSFSFLIGFPIFLFSHFHPFVSISWVSSMLKRAYWNVRVPTEFIESTQRTKHQYLIWKSFLVLEWILLYYHNKLLCYTQAYLLHDYFSFSIYFEVFTKFNRRSVCSVYYNLNWFYGIYFLILGSGQHCCFNLRVHWK